jgi:DNA-binding XRE family transcriptional regulator
MTMYFEARIRKDGKGYRVTFPGLDNVLVYADSKQDAVKSAREALVGCLLEDMERGFDLPVPITRAQSRGTQLIPVPVPLGIALLLRRLRHRKQWTTFQVAKRLGISRQAYEKLERGTANPSLQTLEKTFTVFGVVFDLTTHPMSCLGLAAKAA